MIELATCSYYEFRPEMGQPVRISLGIPKFKISWQLPSKALMDLAPRGHYFHDPADVFAQKYLAQLDRVGVDSIRSTFEEINEGYGPLVLLCFERNARTRDDCHRRRFADWWQEKTGQYIPEFGGKFADTAPAVEAKVPEEPDPLW